MGKDIIQQIVNFDSLNLSFLCEKKNHRSIGKKVRDIPVKDSMKDLINAGILEKYDIAAVKDDEGKVIDYKYTLYPTEGFCDDY